MANVFVQPDVDSNYVKQKAAEEAPKRIETSDTHFSITMLNYRLN